VIFELPHRTRWKEKKGVELGAARNARKIVGFYRDRWVPATCFEPKGARPEKEPRTVKKRGQLAYRTGHMKKGSKVRHPRGESALRGMSDEDYQHGTEKAKRP